MMGPMVAGSSEDGAVALLKVIGDPKAYEQKLEELNKRTEEARAAEAALADARRDVTEGRTKLDTDVADLTRRDQEFRSETGKVLRTLERDRTSLHEEQERFEREQAERAEQEKKSLADLAKRDADLAARAARLDEREADIVQREKFSKADRVAAEKDRAEAQKLRADLDDKIARLTEAMRSVA